MLRTESKLIGRYEYTVTQFPTSKARLLFFRLVKAIGPSAGRLLGGAMATKGGKGLKTLLDLDISGPEIGGVLEQFFTSLPEEEFERMVAQCFGDHVSVTISDEAGKVRKPKVTPEFGELHFADNLVEYFKVLWFVLEVNYGNFLGVEGLGAKLAAAAGSVQAAEPSQSPQELTGKSGG